MPRKAHWKHLIETDDDFRRWYQNLTRGSVNTANLNARTLYRFCRLTKTTPAQIVERVMEDRRGFEDTLLDFVTRLRAEKKADSYIENYVTCVKSWLQFNDVSLVRKIKIGNTNRTPTIENERVPVKEELRQIFNYSGERGRCSISLMAFSGLRPQVLGDATGMDGLKIRDFPELEIRDREAEFSTVPTMVIVRSELSKAKHKYFTFLGPEGCEYIKAYLERRLALGEELEGSSAIISCKEGYEETGYRSAERGNQHITTKTLTKEIRDAMRPRYRWRPYVLRAYFDTQLLVAENNGKIAHAYRQFFMGHKGDIEARYTTNKGRLPESVIEDMRDAYRKSLEYLETRKTGVSDESVQDALRRQLLLLAGFTAEEIEGMDQSMSDEEFQEKVRRKLVGSMVNNGNSQRVIKLGEVEEFLNRGWQFVAKLTDDKAILRLP